LVDSQKDGEAKKDLFPKGKDFMDMYSRVAEFTRELMEENHKLQARINELMSDRERLLLDSDQAPEEANLLRRLEEVKKEKQDLLQHYRRIEEENKDFQHRYHEIESVNNNLANLYVASYQLHSTLDLNEVLYIITEIIINLIGAQTFSIMLLNDKKGCLEAVKTEGLSFEEMPALKKGEGVIGQVAASGEIFYRETYFRHAPVDPKQPLVCVPLKINEEVIGVIAVYELLPQKEKLLKIDYDLFSLLAAHAATAIFSAKLYGDSLRKQATIKGFLDLITH